MVPDIWTLEAAMQHLTKIIAESDRRYEERFVALEAKIDATSASADRALGKAEFAYEKRFDAMNEFREAMGDQQRTFIPRAEFDITHAMIQKQVDDLSRCAISRTSEGSGMKAGWIMAVGALGVVLALVGLLLR
jgi:hypothetical protein